MTDPATPAAEEPDEAIVATPATNAGIYARVIRLMQIRAEIDILKEEAGQVTYELEQLVPRTALFADQFGDQWRATVVRPDDTVLVNLDQVLSMSPELYHRITKVDLDRHALNRALRAGAVSREVADAAMSLRPNSPSVRLTRVDAGTEEEPDE